MLGLLAFLCGAMEILFYANPFGFIVMCTGITLLVFEYSK